MCVASAVAVKQTLRRPAVFGPVLRLERSWVKAYVCFQGVNR